jgi:hypothetical protein
MAGRQYHQWRQPFFNIEKAEMPAPGGAGVASI